MADETTWTLPAETKEFVGPITVLDGQTPVTNFEVTVTRPGIRPSNWQAATVLSGQRGVLVGTGTPFPLLVGQKYTVWIRFTDTPEIPVERVGFVKVI